MVVHENGMVEIKPKNPPGVIKEVSGRTLSEDQKQLKQKNLKMLKRFVHTVTESSGIVNATAGTVDLKTLEPTEHPPQRSIEPEETAVLRLL